MGLKLLGKSIKARSLAKAYCSVTFQPINWKNPIDGIFFKILAKLLIMLTRMIFNIGFFKSLYFCILKGEKSLLVKKILKEENEKIPLDNY